MQAPLYRNREEAEKRELEDSTLGRDSESCHALRDHRSLWRSRGGGDERANLGGWHRVPRAQISVHIIAG